MKRELALQLLRSILPESLLDEDRFQSAFEELGILAELKYNHYEMYQPGRLFFENLYAWLSRFEEQERIKALNFVRENLIFISREEFQQLTQILYYDQIYQSQLDMVAERMAIPRFKVKQLAEHPEMKRIERASLYVAMSDGARIDYFRRQNLAISNEQVLPIYYANADKFESAARELEKDCGTGTKFDCLFLLDDFTASGRTLLREIIREKLSVAAYELTIPKHLESKLKYNAEKGEIQFAYQADGLTEEDEQELANLSASPAYRTCSQSLIKKHKSRETEVDGALIRLANYGVLKRLSENARVFLCPLLITEYALERLNDLIGKIPRPPLNNIKILPGAVIPDTVRIAPASRQPSPIVELCEKYYSSDLEDEHTGNVKYGYDECGLPVILHHNTPNNSIYLLWARKQANPLFARYERHGR